MLTIGNVKAKAFILDIRIKLTDQLKEELRQANIILDPATYSQAIKSKDMDEQIDIIYKVQSFLKL